MHAFGARQFLQLRLMKEKSMSSDKKIERALRDLVFPWIRALGIREGLEHSSDLAAKSAAKVYLSACGGDSNGAANLMSDFSRRLEQQAEQLRKSEAAAIEAAVKEDSK